MSEPETLSLIERAVEATHFSLVVYGDPVPKHEGRIMKFGKHMAIRKHPATERYEAVVTEQCVARWKRPPLQNVAVTLTLRFYRAIPKSFTRKQRALILAGELRPLTRPDNTNLLKSFEDGINGIVIADDCLIVETHVSKWYSDTPRVEMDLHWSATT